jgi:hypothetical protein
MAVRTYLPTLLYLVDRICKFINDHRSVIRANLSGQALSTFDSMAAACLAFRTAYGAIPVEP